MTIKKINNRIKQKQLESYSTRNEITETLYLLRPLLSPIAYKWMSYFENTLGSTQAKITTICEKTGVAVSTFYNTVKPELDALFQEPIIKIKKADPKLDHSRTKKVRASEFKILQPLHKIKYLIRQFKKAQEIAEKKDSEDFMKELFSIPGIDNGIINGIESNSVIPCQTSAESENNNMQVTSFRENLLEKSFNKLNTQQNFIEKSFGKIKIKKDIKNYLNTFPLFRDFHAWSELKRYEIAKTLQLAIIKTKTDIQDIKNQFTIKNAIRSFNENYQNKPKNEFLKLLYVCTSNALKPQEDDSEHSEDDSEDDSDFWTGSPVLKILDEKENHIKKREIPQEKASKEELDDMGLY